MLGSKRGINQNLFIDVGKLFRTLIDSFWIEISIKTADLA
jgi:hypothetical protein